MQRKRLARISHNKAGEKTGLTVFASSQFLNSKSVSWFTARKKYDFAVPENYRNDAIEVLLSRHCRDRQVSKFLYISQHIT